MPSWKWWVERIKRFGHVSVDKMAAASLLSLARFHSSTKFIKVVLQLCAFL